MHTIGVSNSLVQIKPYILSGLNWFRTVCKSYHETTLVGIEPKKVYGFRTVKLTIYGEFDSNQFYFIDLRTDNRIKLCF